MLTASRPASYLRENTVTPRDLVLSRRTLLAGGAAALAVGTAFPASAGFSAPTTVKPTDAAADTVTPFKSSTTYNNFYEFGSSKSDPSRYANALPLRPWQVVVDGEVAKPATFGIEDLLRLPLEERIYRLRCVEGWSMVIPWTGFALADLLKRAEPTSRARYVAFQTALDVKNMPGVRYPLLDWPYAEGLRLDEAMHPLAILAVGMYGDPLPPQNGAPIRLVVPWKYGFKSIKSVVRITLVKDQPPTAWNRLQPDEYGFYANVNPDVSHPRWSQANERRVGDFFRRKTLPFNGYGEEVASLYAGMDLRANY